MCLCVLMNDRRTSYLKGFECSHSLKALPSKTFKTSKTKGFCLIEHFLLPLSSLPQKIDRPLCALSQASTEKYQQFESQSYATGHQHVINNHLDGYDIEDEILCDNMDDESNHSYVFLQQQQHYTPPPVEFQEGATPQHQTLIKKGSIMRNNPELMKRNRQNNSWVSKTFYLTYSITDLVSFSFIRVSSAVMNYRKISSTNRSSCSRGNMVEWGHVRPLFAFSVPFVTTRWWRSLHLLQPWLRPTSEYQIDVACSRLSVSVNTMPRAETNRDRKFVPCKLRLC